MITASSLKKLATTHSLAQLRLITPNKGDIFGAIRANRAKGVMYFGAIMVNCAIVIGFYGANMLAR